MLFAVSALIIFGVSSCDKKAKNLDDLKKKYEGKEFKNCDDFEKAFNEIFDVYFATIDKAAEGNEDAKKELENFDAFLGTLDKANTDFEKDCPEKAKELQETMEKKMEEYLPKLMKAYGLDGLFDNADEDYDWDLEEEDTLDLAEEVVD